MKALFLLLAVALAATTAQAKPFKDFCDQLEPLRKLSGLKYVKPQVKVDPKAPGAKPQDVVFTIEAKSGNDQAEAPAPMELIELPMTDALCAENP